MVLILLEENPGTTKDYSLLHSCLPIEFESARDHAGRKSEVKIPSKGQGPKDIDIYSQLASRSRTSIPSESVYPASLQERRTPLFSLVIFWFVLEDWPNTRDPVDFCSVTISMGKRSSLHEWFCICQDLVAATRAIAYRSERQCRRLRVAPAR
jgi:hypothetical protein